MHMATAPAQAAQAVQEEAGGVEEGSLYEVLGVSPQAAVDEIKAAYRKEARKSHPDFAKGEDERIERQQRFEKVNYAFRMLNDPDRRQAYDLSGLAGLASFEDSGERTISPPPWRVLIGHTSHHFWKREELFVGLLMETRGIDVPIVQLRAVWAEATKDPVGVGHAVLVERCTERKANDIVDALSEYGFVCLAQEIEDETPEASETEP